jgi:hypothetical protein
MIHLTHEQQVFVLHQVRNWAFGHYAVFNALNAAWAAHGAEAYFWNWHGLAQHRPLADRRRREEGSLMPC